MTFQITNESRKRLKFRFRMTLTYLEKTLLTILAVIGLRILFRLSVLVWRKLVAPNLGLAIDLTKQGKWAVVTGSTSGIGKEFAKQLAKQGLNVVLVSQSQTKLEETADEIKQKYNVEVRIVQANLTEGQAVYSRIAKATEELEVLFLFSIFIYLFIHVYTN